MKKLPIHRALQDTKKFIYAVHHIPTQVAKLELKIFRFKMSAIIVEIETTNDNFGSTSALASASA